MVREGGRGVSLNIIVLYHCCAIHGSTSSTVYGGCDWVVSKIYGSHYVILSCIAKVAEVAEVARYTGGEAKVPYFFFPRA